MEEAIRETENLNDGEVFLVKDLFKGYVWNRIPRKDRLLLGTLFLNHVSKIVVSKSAPSILCYTPTLKTTLKKLFSGI